LIELIEFNFMILLENFFKKNVRFTAPTQQEHNTPSHEGGAQCVESTLM
jgi:hypothetical protein